MEGRWLHFPWFLLSRTGVAAVSTANVFRFVGRARRQSSFRILVFSSAVLAEEGSHVDNLDTVI